MSQCVGLFVHTVSFDITIYIFHNFCSLPTDDLLSVTNHRSPDDDTVKVGRIEFYRSQPLGEGCDGTRVFW